MLPTPLTNNLVVDNQGRTRDFHSAAARKCPLDCRHISVKQVFEFNVADVPGRNKQQRWLTGEQKRPNEITILGHHDSVVAQRTRDNIRIWCSIPKRQVQGVQGVVPMLPQPPDESPGQLRIDQKFHAVRGSARFTWARRAAYARAARMSSRSRSG